MFTQLKMGVIRKKMTSKVWNSDTGKTGRHLRMGVIIDSGEKDLKEVFLNLKKDLHVTDSQFSLVICQEEGEKKESTDGLVFTRRDLSWKGKIKNEEVRNFTELEKDVLICFTSCHNKLANLLASVVRADLKVGREVTDNQERYDMVITTGPDEVDLFVLELKKYLKILNKI